MKINIIKQETMGLKCLLKKLGGIKVKGSKLQMMLKNREKKFDSFAVSAKIILYITNFFKNFFLRVTFKKYR